MKRLLLATIILASLTFFVSCAKTTPIPSVAATNPNPIVGLWVGTFQITDDYGIGSFYYSFDLFSDSTIIQQGGATGGLLWTGKGTWSLSGDTAFTANVANTDVSQGSWTQRLTAKYDSTAGTLSNGVWVFTAGQNTSGTFSLKRVQ